nr:PREDICTED: uncharacterized protein LOC108953198 [Musa acuminata subsp. malaccensis]
MKWVLGDLSSSGVSPHGGLGSAREFGEAIWDLGQRLWKAVILPGISGTRGMSLLSFPRLLRPPPSCFGEKFESGGKEEKKERLFALCELQLRQCEWYLHVRIVAHHPLEENTDRQLLQASEEHWKQKITKERCTRNHWNHSFHNQREKRPHQAIVREERLQTLLQP